MTFFKVVFIFSLVLPLIGYTQIKTYSYSSNGGLYQIDLSDCSAKYLGYSLYVITKPDGSGTVQLFTDIAVTPNGRIFLIMAGAALREVDPTNASTLSTWLNTQGYTYQAALVALDNDHLIAIASTSPSQFFLINISLVDQTIKNIGSIGSYRPGGDITWLHGDLYMSDIHNHLIRFKLSADYTAIIAIEDVGKMATLNEASYGLTSLALKGCKNDSSEIYSHDGPDIFAINPYTVATRLVCKDLLPSSLWSNGSSSTQDALNRADTLICPKPPTPVDPGVEPQAPYFFIPNLFTPNGDGHNEVFCCSTNLSLLNIHMRIYNRWGALVYEEQSANPAWDGDNFPFGVYYYSITTNYWGEEKEYKGIVSLIK